MGNQSDWKEQWLQWIYKVAAASSQSVLDHTRVMAKVKDSQKDPEVAARELEQARGRSKDTYWWLMWSWFVYPFILSYTITNAVVVAIFWEFVYMHTGYWFGLMIGLPVSLVIGGIVLGARMFLAPLVRPRYGEPSSIKLKAARKNIFAGWCMGLLILGSAFFLDETPFGSEGTIVWVVRIQEFLFAAFFTWLFAMRYRWGGLGLLFLFVLWKLPFWGYHHPKASFFAGLIISSLIWRGVVAIGLERHHRVMEQETVRFTPDEE